MALPDTNLLGAQTSPYLLQHKDNPVHWRPWTTGALDEAQELDKPILLSVGYAACHWCHVMAHECFEDPEVAEVMNRLFVNIKVDREERPDIDQIYMTALTATGEQGGWPLTMFLTPQAKPFWGGTYFPKLPRFGRPGLIEILNAVHTAWHEKRAELDKSAGALTAHVQARLAPISGPDGQGSEPPLHSLAENIAGAMDSQYGGLRGAPKFPNAPFLNILWLDWLENRKKEHRDIVLRTLRFMLSGGIYDHVGGGLARYSTDAAWLVPHFEKMLYDNAQLVHLAGLAYAETGDQLFRMRIEETAEWMLRELWLEGGGFASSLDADSEGEEGKFYLWNQADIENVLGEDTEELLTIYGLASPEGWEGDPILNRLDHPDAVAQSKEKYLRGLLERLRKARERRPRPGRDDKILVDWNGMAIAALASAGRQLNRPEWIEAAHNAFRFVCESMDGHRLPHSIRENNRLFPGLASDYASMISAAVSLFEALQDDTLIDQAVNWAKMLTVWHGDENETGFFLSASDSRDVPIRIRGDVDEAIPSSTALIIVALTKLSTVTGDHTLYLKAVSTAQAALQRAETQPYGQAGIVYAAAIARRPMKLLINDTPNNRLVSVANRIPDSRRTDIVLGQGKSPAEKEAGISVDRSRPGAWLCIGQRCLPPLHDAVILEATLRAPR